MPLSSSPSFLRELPRAFTYPLRGRGKYILIAGAAGIAIGFFIAGFAGIIGAILSVFLMGYVAMYMMSVIGDSAGGKDEPPDWPDITNVDDVVRPLMMLIASCAVAFGAALVYIYGRALANAFAGTSYGLPDPDVAMVLSSAGLVYLPMALLSAALFGTIGGLNPLRVIVAIIKVAPLYLVALAVLAAATIASGVLLRYAAFLPFVGELVVLYLIMTLGRILGLIYWTRSRKLNWFGDSDRSAA